VGILTSLITLVFTDSRAASIFALLAIACSYIPYKFSRLLRYIPIVSVILPLLILGTLQRLSPSAIQVLSRNQSDALTLSNRTVIWEVAFDTLRESPENLLFGYGYRGQIVSGAMEKYEYLFGGYVGVFSIPLHNSFLQAVFEIGLVGTILFVLNLITLFVLLDRERQLQNSPWATVLYFTLLFLSLISSTDSVLSFDNQESYIIFMFIATVSFFRLAKEKN
jgi:O-antigen ligase